MGDKDSGCKACSVDEDWNAASHMDHGWDEANAIKWRPMWPGSVHSRGTPNKKANHRIRKGEMIFFGQCEGGEYDETLGPYVALKTFVQPVFIRGRLVSLMTELTKRGLIRSVDARKLKVVGSDDVCGEYKHPFDPKDG